MGKCLKASLETKSQQLCRRALKGRIAGEVYEGSMLDQKREHAMINRLREGQDSKGSYGRIIMRIYLIKSQAQPLNLQ